MPNLYVVDQDVFDGLPEEAQSMIESDATVVTDQEQIDEINQITAEEKPEEKEVDTSEVEKMFNK